VVTDTPPTRAELRALYRDSDRFAAETDEWLARRKAEREALVRKNADEGFEYPDQDENAYAAIPVADDEAPDEEPFSDEQLDTLAITLAELRCQWESNTAQQTNQMDRAVRQEIEHAVAHNAALRRDLAELRGKVDVLITLLGHKARNVSDENNSKSADVIDLPAGFIRKRNDDADAA
jgi:hypothetical protein